MCTKKSVMLIGVMLSILVLSKAAFCGDIPKINLIKVKRAPTIDGKLDDTAWRRAVKATNFVKADGSLAKEQTEAYICYDNTHLYIGLKCKESNPSGIKAIAKGEMDIWSSGDDVLAIIIKPDEREDTYYQFAINSKGIKFDQKVINSKKLYGEYSPEWQIKTKINKNNWAAEVSFPFKAFGITEEMGKTWRINFFRNRTQSNEESFWRPVSGNFHNLTKAGYLRGLIIEKAEVKSLVYLKEISIDKDEPGSGIFKGKIKSRAKQAINAEAIVEIKSPAGNINRYSSLFDIGKRERKDISVNYKILLEEGKHVLRLILRDHKTKKNYYTSPPANISVSSFMDACFSRNYYTTEKEAELIVEIKELGEETLKDMKLESKVLKPESDKVIIKKTTKVSKKSSFKFKISGLKDGEYPVAISLLNKKGKSITSSSETLRKLPSREMEVKIDKENRIMLLNNKPYFMLSMFRVPHDQLENVAAAEFNTAFQFIYIHKLVYKFWKDRDMVDKVTKHIKDYLDEAKANNLNVVLAITHGSLTCNTWANVIAVNDKLVEKGGILEVLIPRIREHPALLAYYSIGEPSILGSDFHKKREEKLTKDIYNVIRRLDPYHPIFPIFCKTILFKEGRDIICIDNYWQTRTGTPLSVVPFTDSAVVIAAKEHKPYFDVPCCSRWSGGDRGLTSQEQRAQTYLDIVHGTVGFSWFRYRPFSESVWTEMKKINLEIKELSPIILSGSPSQQIMNTSPIQPIHILLKEYRGKIYLIAVNSRNKEVKAKFSFSDGLTNISDIKVLFEDRELRFAQASFSDSFQGYASHVYEITGIKKGNQYVIKVDADVKEKKVIVMKRKNTPNITGIVNLVPNSSAEVTINPDLPDYWYFNWNWNWDKKLLPKIDKSTSVDGYNSICIKNKGCKASIPYWYQAKKIKKEKKYTFSLFMKADKEETPVHLRFGASWGNWTKTEVVKVGNEWKRYMFTTSFDDFVPNYYQSSPRALVYVTPQVEGVKLWIDAVQIEKGGDVHPYTEDKATKAYWEGKYPIPWRP